MTKKSTILILMLLYSIHSVASFRYSAKDSIYLFIDSNKLISKINVPALKGMTMITFDFRVKWKGGNHMLFSHIQNGPNDNHKLQIKPIKDINNLKPISVKRFAKQLGSMYKPYNFLRSVTIYLVEKDSDKGIVTLYEAKYSAPELADPHDLYLEEHPKDKNKKQR